MSKESLIKCPKCGVNINISDVLYKDIDATLKKSYEKKFLSVEKEKQELEKKLHSDYESKLKSEKTNMEKMLRGKIEKKTSKGMEQLKKELEAKKKQVKELNIKNIEIEKLKKSNEEMEKKLSSEYQSKLKLEKANIEKKIRGQIENETSESMEQLKKELEAKTKQVKELNLKNIEIEKLKREKNELKETIELEKERELTAKLNEERIKIKRSVEEGSNLKIKEQEKIINDLKVQIDEVKRKAEQGSVQLQGEIQELEIENTLRLLYPLDDISEVKKGQKGADIIQTVKNPGGTVCGKIYYESKRTKHFDNSWLQKLKDDNQSVNADVLVLITEAMSDDIEKYAIKDGVWICSYSEFKPFSLVIRFALIEAQKHKTINKGQSAMELIYGYLTSVEFKGQFESIVTGFKQLEEGYHDEQKKIQKIWKEREKQLERIWTNTINIYGSLKGLGGDSIPEIKMLED